MSQEPFACFVGFDGFIDTLCRVIATKNTAGDTYYEALSDWSSAVAFASGKSANFELELIDRRLGGNAILLANALCHLGQRVYCAATVGEPGKPQVCDRVFEEFIVKCAKFVNLGQAGQTHALEFSDGKLLLGIQGQLPKLSLQDIEHYLGDDWIAKWLEPMDLIALTNWTMTLKIGAIIDALTSHTWPSKPRTLLIDPADPLKRDLKELRHDLLSLENLSFFTKVLSMNYSEALQVCKALWDGKHPSCATPRDLVGMVHIISQKLPSFVIVIHDLRQSVIGNLHGVESAPSPWIEAPVITTGGGDHFNAGLVHAILNGFSPKASIIFAAQVAACYVRDGISPSVETVRSLSY